MKRLLLIIGLLMLAGTASAELRVLPDEGMLLGMVTSDTPGKWVVFGEGYLPVQPTVADDGKLIHFQGPAGLYGIVFFPEGDGQPFIQRLQLGPAKPDPAVNKPPVISSNPVVIGVEGTPYIYNVVATDPDGDKLTFQLTSGPAGMQIDSTTGIIDWSPAQGTHSVSVVVRDALLADTQNFVITVAAAPSSGKYDIMMFYAKEQLRTMTKERNAVLNGLKLRTELEADGHTILEVLEDDVFTEGLASEWKPFAEAIAGVELPVVVLRDKTTDKITHFPLPASPEAMKEKLK